MTDTQKLKLVKAVIGDFFEYGGPEDISTNAATVLSTVDTIICFEEEGENV